MRRFALLLPALLLSSASAPADQPARAVLHSRAIHLDPTRPALRTLGALSWLGGWELTGGDPRFGGISALLREGNAFVALNDAGVLLRFTLPNRGKAGAVDVTPLPEEGARAGRHDTESMTRDPATGRIWVGAESDNAIVRYAAGFARQEAAHRPRPMRGWPVNGGPESLVRLSDGRFLVLSEEQDAGPGLRQALLFSGDPTDAGAAAVRFAYRPPAGYVPTDAAELPGGQVLVLNRRFRLLEGVSAVLTVIPMDGVRDGAVVEGRTLATLRPPLSVDNMEALAVEREGGRTILWIASDDNFNPLQRTLLLKFGLP